jgi:hypothetical protein
MNALSCGILWICLKKASANDCRISNILVFVRQSRFAVHGDDSADKFGVERPPLLNIGHVLCSCCYRPARTFTPKRKSQSLTEIRSPIRTEELTEVTGRYENMFWSVEIVYWWVYFILVFVYLDGLGCLTCSHSELVLKLWRVYSPGI